MGVNNLEELEKLIGGETDEQDDSEQQTEAPSLEEATEESAPETTTEEPEQEEPSEEDKAEKETAQEPETTTQAPEAYKSDYKINVLNEVKELPEWARGGIKDAETEKEIKTLFSKAYGFDKVSEARDSWRNKYEETNKKVSEITNKSNENEQTIDYVANCLDDIDKGDVLVGLGKLCANNNQLLEKIISGVTKFVNADEMSQARMSNDYTRKMDNYYRQREQVQYKQQQTDIQTKYQQVVIDRANMIIDGIIERNPDYKFVNDELIKKFENSNYLKNYIAKIGEQLYPDIENADFNKIVEIAISDSKKYFNLSQPTSQPNLNQTNSVSGQTSPKKTVIVKKENVTQVPSMQSAAGNGAITKGKISTLKDLARLADIDDDE